MPTSASKLGIALHDDGDDDQHPKWCCQMA